MKSKMIPKASSSSAAKNAVMKRKRTTAEKIAAKYAKVRAGLLRRIQQKAVAKSGEKIPSSGVPVGSTALRYYPHFNSSGVPKQIFCYASGRWEKLPEELHGAIKDDLLRKSPVVEVQTNDVQYVLNFVHMYCLDLGMGDVTPMGWTDEADNHFFPSIFEEKENSLKKLECLEDLKGKQEKGDCSRAFASVEEPQDQPPLETEVADKPEEPPQTNVNHEPSNTVRVYGQYARPPRSPFLPFSVLLPLLVPEILIRDMQRINFYYHLFQARNITRQEFIDRIKLFAGDNLIRRTIETFSPPIPAPHAD